MEICGERNGWYVCKRVPHKGLHTTPYESHDGTRRLATWKTPTSEVLTSRLDVEEPS